mgnify:CR=1 FL=1
MAKVIEENMIDLKFNSENNVRTVNLYRQNAVDMRQLNMCVQLSMF